MLAKLIEGEAVFWLHKLVRVYHESHHSTRSKGMFPSQQRSGLRVSPWRPDHYDIRLGGF